MFAVITLSQYAQHRTKISIHTNFQYPPEGKILSTSEKQLWKFLQYTLVKFRKETLVQFSKDSAAGTLLIIE